MPLGCKGLHGVKVNANEKTENEDNYGKDQKEQDSRQRNMTIEVALKFS